MKNTLPRFATVLSLAGIALSLTAWALASDPQPGGPAIQTAASKRQTLREIAQDRDVEVDAPEGENSTEYGDLKLLARDAEAIVVGRIINEESSFDGDDHIITTYKLDIQRVLKHTKLNGPLAAGDEPAAPLLTPLKFVRQGGVIQVNGHTASGKLKGREPLEPSHDVLLFLWWSPAYKAYTLAGGASGAFLVDAELRVRPLALKSGMLKHERSTLDAVIAEVLAAQ